MTKDETKQEQARSLRYKRPALALMGWETITSELSEIQSACDDVSYSMSVDSILDAFDGDEERAWEFQMALQIFRRSANSYPTAYMTMTNCQNILTTAPSPLSETVTNRSATMTTRKIITSSPTTKKSLHNPKPGRASAAGLKKDMLTNIGQCMGVLLAFYDLRQQYDYLKTELDILRGENAAVLQTIKEIEKAYDRQSDLMEWQDDPEFEKLLRLLPDRIWIE